MDSKEYWKWREEENLKKNLKTEAEYAEEINEIYDYMMDSIQKEINGFYAKYAKKEGITLVEAKKRVSEADIKAYERKAAKYVKEKNFSAEANAEMRLYNATMKINRLEMLKANIGLELVDGFDGLQKYFDKILTKRTLDEFERQAGILGKTIHNNAKAAHSIVNASFHNAKFSDRIWMYQDMLKAELSNLLQIGMIQGRNPRVLARHLEKRFGVSKADAERLMRTELARVQTDAQLRSLKENGFDQYEFIALGSACDICKEIDGKHFDIDKAQPGGNAPPMHPNCRCSVAAWEDDEEYEQWLDFLNKGGTTEEWERLKKDNSFEADIGKNISELFTGISKQKKDFKERLESVKNVDVKGLLKQSIDRVTIKRAKGKKSSYSAKDKTLYLAKGASTDTLAHELMHEIDITYGLTSNGLLNESILSDYRRLQNIAKGYGKSIEEMLYLKYPEKFQERKKQLVLREEYRGVSDVLNGMSGGNINLGFGHDGEYWKKKNRVEAETFAQFGRVLFLGDQPLGMAKELFPDCYSEIIGRLEKVMK